MASSSTGTPSVASAEPLTPGKPKKSLETIRSDDWEEYNPSQDEEDGDDGSASRASSSRHGTPIAKTRTRQGTRPAADSPSSTRRTATPIRRRKAAPQPPARAGPIASPRKEIRSQAIEHPAPTRPPPRDSQLVNTIRFALSTAFSIFRQTVLFGVSILSTLLAPYLLPIVLGLVSVLGLGLTAYFLLPLLPSFFVNITAKAIRSVIPSATWAAGSLSNLGVTRSAAIVPARLLVTPACTLLGVGCQLSLLSTYRPSVAETQDGEEEGDFEMNSERRLARPFWQWDWSKVVPDLGLGKGGSSVDVAGVARGLGREVKQARDIFESVQSMSNAGLVRNLHYVKIWELGVAVSVGSTLEGKELVGRELTDLGDLTRDLADEISAVDYAAVNAFTWIQWEFSTLLELLDSPNPPSNATLGARLHSLITQLDSAFAELHTLTSTALDTASIASKNGNGLHLRLAKIRHSLLTEKERDPIWRQAWDKNKHRLVGGEVPRSEMLERDLVLTKDTIEGLGEAARHLEHIRALTKGYRDQLGMTQARMVGFHLGAGALGLEADEEVRVLGRLVDGLGDAVGEAKRRTKSGGRGPARKGYREIEA